MNYEIQMWLKARNQWSPVDGYDDVAEAVTMYNKYIIANDNVKWRLIMVLLES